MTTKQAQAAAAAAKSPVDQMIEESNVSPETPAEKYARLKAASFDKFLAESFTDEALTGVELFDVIVPSGMEFKCRKLDLSYTKGAGQMPFAVAARAAINDNNISPQQMFASMTAAERSAGVRASMQMIQFVCVEPRVMIMPDPAAVTFDDLTGDDFTCLVEWAKSGGGAADELDTFRNERAGVS